MVLLPAAALFLVACSSETSQAHKPASPATARQAERAPTARILQFYASPGVVARGEKVSLCYGVENATAVRLEPAVEPIDPSPNRCIQFSPARTRTYTLIATGAGPAQAAQSVTIRVSGHAPAEAGAAASAEGRLIDSFAATSTEISPGQPITLCYSVHDATSVRIEPTIGQLPVKDRNCITQQPRETVTYTLIVSGNGRSDRERLQIRVK